jgi:hypothetical protein
MATAARASGPETQRAGAILPAPTLANYLNSSATTFTAPPAEEQPGPVVLMHWWRASEAEAYHV